MTAGSARVVAGRYRLLQPLGHGGMGAVWQAHDTLLGRDVAVKEIWFPSAAEGPVDPADPLLRRALREAQAAARLRHPGIVTVHDVVMDSGRPWIVMELVEGQSLAQAIRAHGLLTAERTASIGLHVLDALRAAHREGIAHRDVKPANILLDTDRVVLTDFGIAAIDDATALTATGQMVGSPAYLAPERINGLPATPASDLWSLGVTLYAAVTGRSPFQREDTQATFAAVLHSRPETPAHAGRLWPVIKGLLEKDPARRLTDAQARPLLTNAARSAEAPAERRARWWAPRPRRPEPDEGGPARTVNAPPPTLAAPTAHQPPAAPSPAAEAAGAGAVPAATATAPTVPAADDPGTTATPLDTTTAATVPTESVAGTTATPEVPTAATVPAETAPTLPAGPPDPMIVLAEALAAESGPAEAFGPVPLIRMDAERAAPASPARSRAGWVVAAAAVVVLLVGAGVTLRLAWPDADRDGPGAGLTGKNAAMGSTAPVSAPASRSPSPAPPVNPALDSCLVGRWRMTSMQVINTYENQKTRFTGKVGMIVRIWPDGKEIDDYNKSGPLTATINGHKYVEWLRGVETLHAATKGGRLYSSDNSGRRTLKITRDGRTVTNKTILSPTASLPYICTETTMTSYGDDKVSTQSFERLSHTP